MSTHWSKKHQDSCNDGGRHDGKLELITWNTTEKDGSKLGWGGVYLEEAEQLKEKFVQKYNSNEEAFFAYWPQGFRQA